MITPTFWLLEDFCRLVVLYSLIVLFMKIEWNVFHNAFSSDVSTRMLVFLLTVFFDAQILKNIFDRLTRMVEATVGHHLTTFHGLRLLL